jgi:zinc D-Ala-D-Ala carboxypeptidase
LKSTDKLAKNFTFGELTTTSRKELAAKNAAEAVDFLDAGKALAAMLQAVRDHFGKPVKVHSGFRGRTLNAAVGGAETSQHLTFQAADFHVEGVELVDVFDWIRKSSGLTFGQVILEGASPDKPTWIHLSLGEPWRPVAKCRQALRYDGKRYSSAS